MKWGVVGEGKRGGKGLQGLGESRWGRVIQESDHGFLAALPVSQGCVDAVWRLVAKPKAVEEKYRVARGAWHVERDSRRVIC